jgi:putative transposase
MPTARATQQQFTDLTDSEWEVIEKIVDNGRKIKHQKRIIFNAVLWLLTTGSQWRNLESRFPPWQSVYYHFRQFFPGIAHWKRNGVIEELLDFLAIRTRQIAQRADCPSVLALDSQSVKIVQFTSEAKGNELFPGRIEGGKFINGRKRHLAVDCLGIPWAVLVTAGNISDGAAGVDPQHNRGYTDGSIKRKK